MLYALNMMANLSDDTAGQFQPFGTNSRQWYQSADNGATWTPFGTGSSDNTNPTLNYSNGNPNTADKVQFAVFFTGAAPSAIQSASIFVTFGSAANGNSPIASPFRQQGNNVRAVLGDEGAQYYSSGGSTAYFIGPYQVSVNQGRSGSGLLKFDFAMIAKFVLSNGQIYEYGYDPEMDVEVSS